MTTQLSKVILLKYLPAADLHAANVPADEPQPPHQVPPAPIIPVVVGGDNYGAEKVREKNPQKSALSLDERPWHHVRDVFCPDQQYTQP